jgi:hypothetical protein
MAKLRYCSGICLEGLRKTTNTQCLGQDSNQAPPEYKCRALLLNQLVCGTHIKMDSTVFNLPI